MAFRIKITANTLLQNRYLRIDEGGVEYSESALTSGKRRFPYQAIDHIFISQSNELTIQVGGDLFTLPIKPENRQYQAFIEALLQNVQATMPLNC